MTPTLFAYTLRAISVGLLVSVVDLHMGGDGMRGFVTGITISLWLTYRSVRDQR